ncbi:MAG TPA: hypothetical protein VHY22_00365 [Chthoniobacteraceae bacterium]|jgi:hypothetical protein|nr:hypothetical protein [Chthoniobacteraceae bacterium]
MRIRARDLGAAFTLVEMLVSVAVLVILLALIFQLFSGATASVNLSAKRMDTDETARLVLDRIGADIEGMVKRPDVNYIFYKGGPAANGGNDAMFFYSEAPAYLSGSAALGASGSASGVALTGYRISTSNIYHPNVPVLERLGQRLTWGGEPNAATGNPGGMVFLTTPAAAGETLAQNWSSLIGTPPYNTESDYSAYQVVSDQVFRMELTFLIKSGTFALSGTTVTINGSGGYSTSPTAISSSVPAPYISMNYFSGGSQGDLAGNVNGLPPDLAGIVVTIAMLDHASQQMLGANAGSDLVTLDSKLQDSLDGDPGVGNIHPFQTSPQPQDVPPATAWQNFLNTAATAGSAGMPRAAFAQVHVYERVFYLQPN